MKKKLKKVFKYLFIALLLVAIFSMFSYYKVERFSKDYVYTDINKIPKQKVGLVLGTIKTLKSGGMNPYFRYRIEAAVKLYNAGKIKYIIVSGDNHIKGYDEPTDMLNELVKRGIPENKVFLDYAGFRTLDSVIRCKEVFCQKSYTIISQDFHNRRAVYIGQKRDINVIAFNADDVNFGRRNKLKEKIRETLARVNAIIDIHILIKSPKFLGEKITIN